MIIACQHCKVAMVAPDPEHIAVVDPVRPPVAGRVKCPRCDRWYLVTVVEEAR